MNDTNPNPVAVRDAMRANRAALAGYCYEREAPIHTSMLALLTREHAVWVGPPGTAKSLLARLVAGQVSDATYREFLLSRQTTEADIIATKSIPDLMAGREVWLTERHLTEGHVAFADEVFKASGSTLNAMLAWLNERIVKGSLRSPLVSCFAASNEWIEDDSLKALRDRFLFGHQIGYMHARDTRVRYLRDRAARRPLPTLQRFTLGDLAAAQAEAERLPMEPALFDALADCQLNLLNAGVEVSDRTLGKCCAVVQAEAWLAGDEEAGAEHVDPLRHVLWTTPNEIPIVERAVAGIDRGPIQQIRAIADEALADYYELAPNGDAWASDDERAAFEAAAARIMAAVSEAGVRLRNEFPRDRLTARAQRRVATYMTDMRAAFDLARRHAKLSARA